MRLWGWLAIALIACGARSQLDGAASGPGIFAGSGGAAATSSATVTSTVTVTATVTATATATVTATVTVTATNAAGSASSGQGGAGGMAPVCPGVTGEPIAVVGPIALGSYGGLEIHEMQIAMAPSGAFIVGMWPYYSKQPIYFFDAKGNQTGTLPIGPYHSCCSLATSDDGSVIAFYGANPYGYARIDKLGQSLGPAVTISDAEANVGGLPAIALGKTGEVIAGYPSDPPLAMYYRRFDAADQPLGPAVPAIEGDFIDRRAAVARQDDGSLVIAAHGGPSQPDVSRASWFDTLDQPSASRSFSSFDGKPWQAIPSVAVSGAGASIVAVTVGSDVLCAFTEVAKNCPTLSDGAVFVGADGFFDGVEYQSVAMDANGAFVAAWTGQDLAAHVRRFAAAAQAKDNPSVVYGVTGTVRLTRVAAAGCTGYAVAWVERDDDTKQSTLFAERIFTQ